MHSINYLQPIINYFVFKAKTFTLRKKGIIVRKHAKILTVTILIDGKVNSIACHSYYGDVQL